MGLQNRFFYAGMFLLAACGQPDDNFLPDVPLAPWVATSAQMPVPEAAQAYAIDLSGEQASSKPRIVIADPQRGLAHVVLSSLGDDAFFGAAGNDVVYGGDGDNVLFGGAGDGLLFGGGGDNILYGGHGNDIAFGGSGNDIYVFRKGEGDDYFDGGGGINSIRLQGADGGPVLEAWALDLLFDAAYTATTDRLTFPDGASGTLHFERGRHLTFTNAHAIEWGFAEW
jgi:hypothetical protein